MELDSHLGLHRSTGLCDRVTGGASSGRGWLPECPRLAGVSDYRLFIGWGWVACVPPTRVVELVQKLLWSQSAGCVVLGDCSIDFGRIFLKKQI